MSGLTGARLISTGAAVVCLLTAVYLGSANRDADQLRRADDSRRAHRYVEAISESRKVTRPPFDAQAALVRAESLERLRRVREASDSYRLAATLEPNDWFVHQRWAVVLLDLGRRRDAAREMGRALALNPRMQLPRPFVRAKRGSGARRR